MSAERLAQFRAGIGAIGKKMTQPGETVANGLYEIACAVAILNVGCMNDHEQHQSDRVGNDVTFAALDLLSGVITANTATFRGFNALAVDHAGRRAGFATFQFTGVESLAEK